MPGIGQIDDDQINWSSAAGDMVINGDGTHTSRKNNFAGGAMPTGSDSFATGYSVGSLWVYGNRIWTCTGDGVWKEMSVEGEAQALYVAAGTWQNTSFNSSSGFLTFASPTQVQNGSSSYLYYSAPYIRMYYPGLYRFDYRAAVRVTKDFNNNGEYAAGAVLSTEGSYATDGSMTTVCGSESMNATYTMTGFRLYKKTTVGYEYMGLRFSWNSSVGTAMYIRVDGASLMGTRL